MSPPISVFIITVNEEARIAAAFESLSGCADEVIVLDSGSTDRTCVILEALGAGPFSRMVRLSPVEARRGAPPHPPWVLNIDTGEIVTPELAAAEISVIIRDNYNDHELIWKHLKGVS